MSALQFAWLTPTAPYSDSRERALNLQVVPFVPFPDHPRSLVLLRQALFPLIHLLDFKAMHLLIVQSVTVLVQLAQAHHYPCHHQPPK